MTFGGFFLSGGGEVAHPFHISDDTCKVIKIVGTALRTFLKIAFIDMSAMITQRIGDIECEVVTSLLGGNAQQLTILVLAQMLL